MNIKYQYIDAIRGDDCYIPLLVEIPENSIYRIHLRRNTEASEYYILTIVENNVFIPSTITENLLDHFEFDIEVTIGDEVQTIQHTDIEFIPDVTRQYGDVKQIEVGDFEREKIIAKEFFTRDENGQIIPFKFHTLSKIIITGVQNYSNRNFQINKQLVENSEPFLYLNGLYVFNDNNFIIEGTTLTLTNEMYAPGPNDTLTLFN